jgi:hypothetical protein
MPQWIRRVNARFLEAGCAARVVASFGHTGNFILEDQGDDGPALRAALDEALGTPYALVAAAKLRGWVAALERPHHLPKEDGARWTPGLVILVSGKADAGPVRSTTRGEYERLGPACVAAWKHDVEDADGRLDPNRRSGGWGGFAADVGEQVGGKWTARSVRTLKGILARAGYACE